MVTSTTQTCSGRSLLMYKYTLSVFVQKIRSINIGLIIESKTRTIFWMWNDIRPPPKLWSPQSYSVLPIVERRQRTTNRDLHINNKPAANQ